MRVAVQTADQAPGEAHAQAAVRPTPAGVESWAAAEAPAELQVQAATGPTLAQLDSQVAVEPTGAPATRARLEHHLTRPANSLWRRPAP